MKNKLSSDILNMLEKDSDDSDHDIKASAQEIIQNQDKIDAEDRMNKFKIKNFELAKNFMKGRQFGRENTPVRSKASKKRKAGLSKIKTNLPQYKPKAPKAWDEESQASVSGVSFDKVEPFDTPKNKKITRMSNP